MTFEMKTFAEARSILDEFCLRIDKKPASTNKTLKKKPNQDGNSEAWWLAQKDATPAFDSNRSIAYLTAYVQIAGSRFYGSGIPLEDGFMYPDRGVMKAMLHAGCVTIGINKQGLFKLTPKGRKLISGSGAASLAQLRPDRKRLVFDILKELKINVSDWANYKGPPAANPKYCYEWAFEKPDKFVVLCLWHDELEEENGSIFQIKNYRLRSKNPHPVRVRRAERADEYIARAFNQGLPIRVIIVDGGAKGGTKGRILDDVAWAVTSYDFDTGEHFLERGAKAEKNEGYQDIEYSAHEGEAWKRTALITQRIREHKFRAKKIEEALAKNHGRLICEVQGCGFDFFRRYGDIGRNYAHVHHREPLSKAPMSGKTLRLADLAIVCANCHAMVHVGGACRDLNTLIPSAE
ncbi:HNH endonuclease [Bradyrhizobium sp. 166]|uniref:HNH endonuclease n=1 Tax=Bradyrhizobium sp. 166 TaxID=2782638 RepID=UPI001FFADA71|nr:HNH endonuclease [Bradyrhizobium sp. 166]MCK1607251.1 HNH endonuclease [Bradyrhizobium sp. 166]